MPFDGFDMGDIRRIDFSPDEWLAGTHELSEFDRGVYITICALIWSRGERVTEELIARHCRAHGSAIKAAIRRLENAGKTLRIDEKIGQKRAEKELENARKRVGKWSDNLDKANDAKVLAGARAQGDSRARLTINHQLSVKQKEDSPPSAPPKGRDERKANGHDRSGELGAAASAEASRDGRASNARGTRLTAEWQPDFACCEFAAAHGLDPGRTADEFVDYWRAQPGQRGIKVDWAATWRNWCRRNARDRQRSQRETAGERREREAREIGFRAMFADGVDPKGTDRGG